MPQSFPTVRPPSTVTLALRTYLTRMYLRTCLYSKLQRIHSTKVNNFKLTIYPGVFHPRYFRSSRFFADVLESSVPLRSKRVLDLGSGSGILSLVAARAGARVVAADVYPEAVRCTTENVIANGYADRIEVLHSDMFANLDPRDRFDYVITNPPFRIAEPHSVADRAWKSSPTGHFVQTLAQEGSRFLKPNGSIMCILSTDAELEQYLTWFQQAGFAWRVVASRRMLFERLYVFQMTPPLSHP